MVVDPETGIKKNNRIRLNAGASRTDAVKAMYDVLKGIKDGEIASTRSAPDSKTFREHYRKVSGRSRVSAIREDNCLKHWEKFLGAYIRISKITSRQILSYRGKMLDRGLSATTANHHVKALRAVMRLARTERYVTKLPMDGIKPLKVKSVERKLFSTDDILKIGTEALRNRPAESRSLPHFEVKSVRFYFWFFRRIHGWRWFFATVLWETQTRFRVLASSPPHIRNNSAAGQCPKMCLQHRIELPRFIIGDHSPDFVAAGLKGSSLQTLGKAACAVFHPPLRRQSSRLTRNR